MRSIATAVAVAALSGLATEATAHPAFARRYKVACHFCHDGFPKLSAIGQRFKERGFRLDKEDRFDADQWLKTVPLAARLTGNLSFRKGSDSVSSLFGRGMSAGNLGARVSYWVDDAFFAAENSKTIHIKPDNAWARFEVIPGGKLYLRGGRMELDLPFTQARTPRLLSYEIYFANTGAESDGIGEFQDGFEVGGELPKDARWSAAIVKGHDSAATRGFEGASKFEGNLFLAASKRFAHNRVGAFGYFGRNRLPVVATPELFKSNRDNLVRIGAFGDVYYRKLNVGGVYMYGRNDNSTGIGRELSLQGGFVQADYTLRDDLTLSSRFSSVRRPLTSDSTSKTSLTSFIPGIQYWFHERVRLSAEYSFNNRNRPNFGAVQAEVAF